MDSKDVQELQRSMKRVETAICGDPEMGTTGLAWISTTITRMYWDTWMVQIS